MREGCSAQNSCISVFEELWFLKSLHLRCVLCSSGLQVIKVVCDE